jgi:hypothetical protein
MSNKNLGGMSADAQAAWRLNLYAIETQKHLARRVAANEAAAAKDKQDIENLLVMQEILRENEQKAKVDAYNLRELQNKNLEEELKERFMSANPAATIYTWLSVKEQIKQAYFIERFNAEKNREQIEEEKYLAYRM